MGEKGNIAESQMALAFLLFEEGDASEAERTVARDPRRVPERGAWRTMRSLRIVCWRGFCSRRERYWMRRKKVPAAHDLLAKSQDFSVRLRASIAEAKVRPLPGKPQEAIRILQDTIASAEKSGYVGFQLEAQLALGEVEKASGKTAAGLSLLTDVRRKAQTKGFLLIANNAGRASVKPASAQRKDIVQ